MWSNERFSSITTTMCSIWSNRFTAASVGAGIRSSGVGGTAAAATSTICRHFSGSRWATARSAARFFVPPHAAHPNRPVNAVVAASRIASAITSPAPPTGRYPGTNDTAASNSNSISCRPVLGQSPGELEAVRSAGPSGTLVNCIARGSRGPDRDDELEIRAERALGDVKLDAHQSRPAVAARARGSRPRGRPRTTPGSGRSRRAGRSNPRPATRSRRSRFPAAPSRSPQGISSSLPVVLRASRSSCAWRA